MFTYIYSLKKYNFWKSGLLLDFFFKKFIFFNLKIFFYIFNILFGEKYFIERNFLKILSYINYIKHIVNFSQKYFTIFIVGFVFILTFFCLFFIINA